jgi:conjugal transfer pilus assembly protein TraF
MRGKQMVKYLIMILCFVCSTASLAENYYENHETGWYWFDDPAQKVIKPIPEKKSLDNDPTESVDKVKNTIKHALDKAIVDPTPENVERYITLQNEMSQRANQFANTWQEVLLKHPELNYSISHPTNNVALQVYHENESKQKNAVLEQFAQHSGLFFFYRSTCPYCQRFAPILKHFAETNHITIIAITMDGISLPEFPDSKHDSGQAEKFHVTVEPSLYAVDPTTQKAYPVAFGLTSETELQNNIYNIMTHYQDGIS